MADVLSVADGAIVSAAAAMAQARERFVTHAAKVGNAIDDLRPTFQGDEAAVFYQVADHWQTQAAKLKTMMEQYETNLRTFQQTLTEGDQGQAATYRSVQTGQSAAYHRIAERMGGLPQAE